MGKLYNYIWRTMGTTVARFLFIALRTVISSMPFLNPEGISSCPAALYPPLCAPLSVAVVATTRPHFLATLSTTPAKSKHIILYF